MSLASKIDIVRAAIFTPMGRGKWGAPLVAWGPIGSAKTSIIEEIGESYALPVVVLSPGEMGEGAFGVVPVPVDGLVRFPPPEWIEQVAGGGLVFLDELTGAGQSIQPALLGLLCARRIGGATLGPRVRLLGAANPPEIAAGGYELSMPGQNRCGHLDWPAPSVGEHAAYMLRDELESAAKPRVTVDAFEEEDRVLNAWPDAWARALVAETSFLAARPDLKNAEQKPPGERLGAATLSAYAASQAWATDRTWEYATRALASSFVHFGPKLDARGEEFVSSFIGSGAASAWFEFMAQSDLPDAAKLLDGRERFEHNRARIDRTAAVLGAVSALVIPKRAERRAERGEAAWALVAQLYEHRDVRDLLIPAVKGLLDAGVVTKGAHVGVMSSMLKIIRAAEGK